ncbi:hypothetical protein AURDEDRAFT_120806 [Auricularia subglabra TFB-10046 SS5]|nr:hypothetical protein AURDEDRAFT_120806 [Auricularia subglabra TFB-10046 SS5]
MIRRESAEPQLAVGAEQAPEDNATTQICSSPTLYSPCVPHCGTSMADRLPAELLSECLRSSDFLMRVRASHVSRWWREVALADRRLWKSFSRTDDALDYHDIPTVCEQLATMLERSSPLLFDVRIPFLMGEELVPVLRPAIHRLRMYDGPVAAFVKLSPEEVPLPHLTCLRILDPYMGDEDTAVISAQWSPRCLPNLREVEGPDIDFSPPCAGPFLRLESLSCYLRYWEGGGHISAACPNLVTLELRNADAARPSRLEPFPASLSNLILRADTLAGLGFRVSATFNTVLSMPDVQQLQRVFLDGARSLQVPLTRLLSLHECPLDATLTQHTRNVCFESVPDGDFAWTIAMYRDVAGATFFQPLETVCGMRLTAITVAMEQLIDFLRQRLNLPGIDMLRLYLNGALGGALPVESLERYSVRVPRLQDFVLQISGRHDTIHSNMADIQSVLSALRWSFRFLVVYDAELLDSLTLFCPATLVEEVRCDDLAHFAKEYTVDTEE